jgi:hypothetical protein
MGDNVEVDVTKKDERRHIGFVWLRVKTNGGLL